MENFNAAFDTFLARAQERVDASYVAEGFGKLSRWTLTAERGARYVRIVRQEGDDKLSRSAWAFVDTTNGDVLKCDGWKRPARGARGNIFDAHNGVGRASWTSVR